MNDCGKTACGHVEDKWEHRATRGEADRQAHGRLGLGAS
jgi:hypothetical protein